MQCYYNKVDLCKDYAVDNVKCKNLEYKADGYPKWDCDFKFKVSNITAYKYDVIYGPIIYTGKVEEYCFIKDEPRLHYYLDYLPKATNPKPTGFNWTLVIVIGSILAIVGILVALRFTEKGRNTFNSFKFINK